MTTAIHNEIATLPVEEKLNLIAEIWSLIDADELEISDELKAELDRRLDTMERDSNRGIKLGEFKRRIGRE